MLLLLILCLYPFSHYHKVSQQHWQHLWNFTACQFKKICQSLFLHDPVILRALKQLCCCCCCCFPDREENNSNIKHFWKCTRCNSHTVDLVSASASYISATSAFLQEWQKISLANKVTILMRKYTVSSNVYLQALGKLHAFSKVLEVMIAHSSECFLLDKTSTLASISFTRMVCKRMY